MDTLIERLEKATGPDRALDCAIAAEFGVMDNFDPSQFIVPVTYRVSGDERRVEAWTQVADQAPWMQASRTPRSYTASIDAALTLVPKYHLWEARQGIEAKATVWRLEHDYDEGGRDVPVGYSTTFPAIAICIAALKARTPISGR